MTYQKDSHHTFERAEATQQTRELAEDLLALVDAGLVAPVRGADGQLRMAIAEPPDPPPESRRTRCAATPEGPALATLSELPVPVRAALVDGERPFVLAMASVRGVCPVAGPVLARAVERVLGVPVVVATPRGDGRLLLFGDEQQARAVARLDLDALRWVELEGAVPARTGAVRRAAA